MKKEWNFERKAYFILSMFGLGVFALIMSYILANFIDENERCLDFIKEINGGWAFFGQAVYSGILISYILYYFIFCFRYELKGLIDKISIKEIIKVTVGLFLKLIIAIVMIGFFTIQSKTVAAVYIGILTLGLIISSVVYATFGIVQGLNRALNERNKKRLEK